MHPAGVLIAQTAVKMGARFAFLQLLHRRHGELDDDVERDLGPPDYSFMDERTRRRWTDLTGGDSVTTPKETRKPTTATSSSEIESPTGACGVMPTADKTPARPRSRPAGSCSA